MRVSECRVMVYLPRWLYERLREESLKRGLTVSSLIREVLMRELGGGGEDGARGGEVAGRHAEG